MLENSVVMNKINALDEKALITRKELSRLVDCALGNILDAQRTGKLQGTKVNINGVETFKFSKAQLLEWRNNSGKMTGFARITISLENKEELAMVEKVLAEAKISFTKTLKQ